MAFPSVSWKPVPLALVALLILSLLAYTAHHSSITSSHDIEKLWRKNHNGSDPTRLEKAYLQSVAAEELAEDIPDSELDKTTIKFDDEDSDKTKKHHAADALASSDSRQGSDSKSLPTSSESSSPSSKAGKKPPRVRDENKEARESLLFSLMMILVSELGDKTFLIAAIMAMTHSRLQIFSAAFSALIVMSVISAALGHAVPNLLPKIYTTYAASLLFLVFGLRMLRDGYYMDPAEVNPELEEVQHELAEKDTDVALVDMEEGSLRAGGDAGEKGKSGHQSSSSGNAVERWMGMVFSKTWVTTFILTFLAEWGDRSQIATIALAAAQNVYWVTLGTIIGHCCCTSLAVVGGRLLADRISVRTVTLTGAVLFLLFSAAYLYEATNL